MVLSGLTFQRAVLRAVLILVTVFGLASARAQPAGELAGSMPEDYFPELRTILVGALQRAPDLMEAQLAIEVREANRIDANAARLPYLGSSFNYGRTELAESGHNSSRSRDNGLFGGVSLNQAIFSWGALKNQSLIAQVNELLAQKSYARAYRTLAVLLRQSYLGLIVQKARVKQGRDALRLAQENLKVMKERLGLGQVASADVGGEELRLREQTLELNRAEADFITARRTFGRLAGCGELAEAAIPGEIPLPRFSEPLTTAIAAALLRDGAKSTLEAQMSELRLREAMLRYDIAKVRLLPKFNFAAGYSLENTTTVGASVGQRAVARESVGIAGSWSFFDGFATRAAKMEARANQRAASARRTHELDKLMQDVQSLERQIKLDAEQLELVDIRHGLAVETHRRIAEESGFGNLPPAAAEQAKNGILLADVTVFTARAAFLGRWSEFVSLASDDPLLDNLPSRYGREKK